MKREQTGEKLDRCLLRNRYKILNTGHLVLYDGKNEMCCLTASSDITF